MVGPLLRGRCGAAGSIVSLSRLHAGRAVGGVAMPAGAELGRGWLGREPWPLVAPCARWRVDCGNLGVALSESNSDECVGTMCGCGSGRTLTSPAPFMQCRRSPAHPGTHVTTSAPLLKHPTRFPHGDGGRWGHGDAL